MAACLLPRITSPLDMIIGNGSSFRDVNPRIVTTFTSERDHRRKYKVSDIYFSTPAFMRPSSLFSRIISITPIFGYARELFMHKASHTSQIELQNTNKEGGIGLLT